MIESAIRGAYPSIYTNLGDLRKDYPNFTPRVRRWSDDLSFLFGAGDYAVRLPEEEVIVAPNGQVKTTRKCGSLEAECELVVPELPELGVVGTVQLGPPGYEPAQDLRVTWDGGSGYVFTRGHCFAALKAAKEPLRLSISIAGRDPVVIEGRYGHLLVAVTETKEGHYYANMRISKEAFLTSNTCASEARAAWPNVGGWAWKR
jgi:hypothetical protein